ncbi:MAG: polyribonucleotide nucleotidyltransferase [Cryomorphaceae bacterium]|nr:MAG: polyribonucleotide nucleotidyltransferase [Cryomorphaceae bacterium]
MNYELVTKTIDLGDGKAITLETGKLAKQADGAVVARMGNTMLLATVVAAQEAREGVDFLPLTVEYREKYSATGKFPGGFFKREARPSEDEILTMRLVDRALRPLFPDDFHAEVQVIINLISGDREHVPDAMACLAASAAIAVSDIPFNGPVSEVRVARINGEYVVNPTATEMKDSDMDMIIAGTLDNIMMVEGEMSEVSEDDMLKAIEVGHAAVKQQCQALVELGQAVPKSHTKRTYQHEPVPDEALYEDVKAACYQACYDIAKSGHPSKVLRKELFSAVKEEYVSKFSEDELAEKAWYINTYYKKVEKEAVRDAVLNEGIRLDGRKTTDIRPIWCEVDYLPMTHGSAIFTRGETQSLTTLTLGSSRDEQTIDSALIEGSSDFMLHYNFPPFCTGEARPIRSTSRREIGHGNLALRALKPVIPPQEENPYTIRIVSDILESNGSSSMATVCAGTLSLMDGGVKIKRPVSGIAMGMIAKPSTGQIAILSDILGDEDHLGDMDFKVTGTSQGITACQMDIKVDGLTFETLKTALLQAKDGREHILNEMLKTISEPRADYKDHTPRIISFTIPKEFIGPVIGPGGKIIQEIQAETNTVISIDEEDGVGVVAIMSQNKEDIQRAEKMVKQIAFPPTVEVGEEYEGKVKSIMPYGAFVEILPGMDGLLHISEIEWHRLDRVEDAIKEGELVKFKVTGKDPKSGKFKLSRKVLLPKPESAN